MSQSRLVFAIVAVVGMAIGLGPTTADDGKPEPRFEITPKVWLVGDPKLDIRVVNLKPNQKVTVVSQMGKQVSRRIEGVADAKGVFDLRGTAEPCPKTGAPFRILWDTKEDPAVEPINESGIHFRAEVDGKVVATGQVGAQLRPRRGAESDPQGGQGPRPPRRVLPPARRGAVSRRADLWWF